MVSTIAEPDVMSSERPRVFVVRRLPSAIETKLCERYDAALNATDETYPLARLIEAARNFDAIVPTVVEDVPAEVFAADPLRARIIANYGVGFDRIDLEAARAHNVVVTNTPGVLTEDTADLAMMLILAAARRTSEGERQLRAGDWAGWRPTHLLGTRVNGATLGIVGFGRIGAAVARRAYRGFGMRVLYVNPSTPDPTAVEEARAQRCASLEELLAASDIVSLHAPAREGTRRMIDASAGVNGSSSTEAASMIAVCVFAVWCTRSGDVFSSSGMNTPAAAMPSAALKTLKSRLATAARFASMRVPIDAATAVNVVPTWAPSTIG